MKMILEGLGMLVVYFIARIFGDSTVAEGYIIMLLFIIALILLDIRDANCVEDEQ